MPDWRDNILAIAIRTIYRHTVLLMIRHLPLSTASLTSGTCEPAGVRCWMPICVGSLPTVAPLLLYNLSHQSDLGSPRIHDRLSLAKPSVAPFVCMNRIRSLMADQSLRDQAFQSSTELHRGRFRFLWNYVGS